MTDLRIQLDEALQHHNARLTQHRWTLGRIADEFLKEAYRIVSIACCGSLNVLT